MARYRLTGRTVLVTGATGGIGAACAHAPHARGADAVLLGRATSSLSAPARRLGPERALPLTADVTEQAALDEAVARAVRRFGGLDVVFATAGTAPARPATPATIDAALFEHIVDRALSRHARLRRPLRQLEDEGRRRPLASAPADAVLSEEDPAKWG